VDMIRITVNFYNASYILKNQTNKQRKQIKNKTTEVKSLVLVKFAIQYTQGKEKEQKKIAIFPPCSS